MEDRMDWIALLPSREDEFTAWSWRALQFTPRVARVDEALLLEVSGSARLFGGRQGLLRLLLQEHPALSPAQWARGPAALVALALLRLKLRGQAPPARLPQDLPLDVLSAALEHVPTLERTGCHSWGDLRALPRGGLARRFGAALLDALDAAHGERPERYPWLTLPEVFDQALELPALATGTPELMAAAEHLLTQLQLWLQARHLGVLALEFEWTLDLRRLDGVALPTHEQLPVRTAQPMQDMAHLRRLVAEHLARGALSAPASHLRLRSLETAPWAGASTSLLPEDSRKGEKLHQLVERLSVRLGEDSVQVPQAQADHRPERKQRWVPARQTLLGDPPVPDAVPLGVPRSVLGSVLGRVPACGPGASDALYPTWLLPEPLPLEVRGELPYYAGGPLRRFARLYRLETGWWEGTAPARRDYFIARSEQAGLVWIYREHPPALAAGQAQPRASRWFLQGFYA